MVIAVPTLSTQRFVTELASKLDFLLAYFISTDRAQSSTFEKYVTSLQSIVEAYSGDPAATSTEIGNQLQAYMERYYDAANVVAKFELTDPDNSQSLIKITLTLNFTEEGVTHSANRLLTYFNGKFKEIVKANNG